MINVFIKFILPVIFFVYVIYNSFKNNETNWWLIGLTLLLLIWIIYNFVKSSGFISVKKSLNIRRVTNNYLRYNHQLSFSSEINEKKNQVIEDILNLVINEPLNQPIIKKHKLNYDKIEEMLNVLNKIGCGQIIKGHYVSISALMFPQTLDFVFSKNIYGRENSDQIAFKLIDWFEKGHSHDLR